MTWAIERLEAICSEAGDLPPIVEQLRLGRLDAWGEGWVRKTWTPHPSLDTADGSLFGGYIAALADQVLAFATMTVIPADRQWTKPLARHGWAGERSVRGRLARCLAGPV